MIRVQDNAALRFWSKYVLQNIWWTDGVSEMGRLRPIFKALEIGSENGRLVKEACPDVVGRCGGIR